MNKRFLLMMDHLPLVNIGKDTNSKERRNPVCIKGQKGFKFLSSVKHLISCRRQESTIRVLKGRSEAPFGREHSRDLPVEAHSLTQRTGKGLEYGLCNVMIIFTIHDIDVQGHSTVIGQ